MKEQETAVLMILNLRQKTTPFTVVTFTAEFYFFATFIGGDVYGWRCDVYGCLRRLGLFATFRVVTDEKELINQNSEGIWEYYRTAYYHVTLKPI